MTVLEERNFEDFFNTPFNVYSSEDAYVSPMKNDLKKFLTAGVNPLFASDDDFTYFTATRDGQPVGRIVAHVHRASNKIHDVNNAYFGYFECINDQAIADQLLGAALDWAKAEKFDNLVGNFNLTAMQQMGVQTGGFEHQGYTDMIVNAPHIPKLLEGNGFEPFFPMTTFEVNLAGVKTPDFKLDESSGFRFAPIKPRDFAERMEDARIILNDGFAENPMFVPLTVEEFQFQAGEMMAILDPRLSSVLFHEDQPVGVVICIPDLNGFMKATRSRIGITTLFHFLKYRFKRKRAVIIYYSVARDKHGLGLMGAMLVRTIKALKDAHYEQVGGTWIGDDNPASLRQMERFGGNPLHRLHLFQKAVA